MLKHSASWSADSLTADIGIGFQVGAEVAAFMVPGGVGVALHNPVSLFSAHASAHQGQQHPLAEHHTAVDVHVAAHVVGIDAETLHHAGHLPQHEMEGDGTVRQHHPFGGAVADVALMPERHVFQGRHHVAAQHPGQAADPFAADRVALVGHGGTALLALGEVLLHLEHIGALQVADLRGEAIEGGAHQGQGLDVVGVAIAGNHLGAGGVRRQAQQLTGDRFHLGIGVGVGAHGATDLTHGHILLQPFDRRLRLRSVSASQPAILKPKVIGSP